ncbi:alanine racemase [Jiangella endophytica]|uniref:alanine racemase n=1 Tax=Jiangella endophytica TaxID=1623398 RepID=UPI000E350C42|nr:alanine racemase [Jiangella endophytica]
MTLPPPHLPRLVLDDAALRHNIATVAAFAERTGTLLAPHIKTHLSGELTRRQLDAGAWGVTVATADQARWAVDFGAPRVLVANEVLEPSGLGYLAQLDEQGVWAACLVDSVDGVEHLDQVLDRPLRVLVELGAPGARCGARTVTEAIAVAAAVRASRQLRLAGVEGYEGVVAGSGPDRLARVDDFLRLLAGLATELDRAGAFAERPVLSAGGSAYLDRVAAILGEIELSQAPLVVLRPGAYVTHDHIAYQELSPFGDRVRDVASLRPAAELWARVLSRPEPGLALLGAGKRECPYDLHLPMVLRAAGPGGERRSIAGAVVTDMNDHHSYLAVPEDAELRPGDAVALGMSHPCTIFDKWDQIPVLDGAGETVEVVHPLVTRAHRAGLLDQIASTSR